MFLQQIVNGLAMGCLYALLALGYSMVYGVLKMVNFAHGELFMLGPMFSLILMRFIGIVRGSLNSIAGKQTPAQMAGRVAMCFLAGAAFSAIVGVLMERVAYRPLRTRNAKSENLMVAAMGVSLFLQNAAMLTFGHQQKGFPSIVDTKFFSVSGARFSNLQVLIVVLVAVLLLSLSYLVNRTYMGRAFRAVSTDRCAAGLMGVNVDGIVALVFVLGPAIGAASGVMYAMTYGQVYYLMGATVGMKGWVSAIIGGIGSVKGSVLGGFVLGFLEVIGAGYLPLLTGGVVGGEYRNIFAFIMLIVVLLFKPEGLFSKRGIV
ncbi:MAG: branched-chain amino acid ABC transporter permease [Ignavibacteriales bacterium]